MIQEHFFNACVYMDNYIYILTLEISHPEEKKALGS